MSSPRPCLPTRGSLGQRQAWARGADSPGPRPSRASVSSSVLARLTTPPGVAEDKGWKRTSKRQLPGAGVCKREAAGQAHPRAFCLAKCLVFLKIGICCQRKKIERFPIKCHFFCFLKKKKSISVKISRPWPRAALSIGVPLHRMPQSPLPLRLTTPSYCPAGAAVPGGRKGQVWPLHFQAGVGPALQAPHLPFPPHPTHWAWPPGRTAPAARRHRRTPGRLANEVPNSTAGDTAQRPRLRQSEEGRGLPGQRRVTEDRPP